MTETQALFNFFSTFGLDVYAASSVPDDVILPYLTFENVIPANGQTVNLTVNLWFHTESEAIPNAVAREIRDAIELGNVALRFDGGVLWLKPGSPFAQAVKVDTAPGLKNRLINITLERLKG